MDESGRFSSAACDGRTCTGNDFMVAIVRLTDQRGTRTRKGSREDMSTNSSWIGANLGQAVGDALKMCRSKKAMYGKGCT